MYFISLEGKSVWCERCRRPFAAAYFPKRTGHVVWCVLDCNAGGSRRQSVLDEKEDLHERKIKIYERGVRIYEHEVKNQLLSFALIGIEL